jgi:hypothetical protein
MLKFLLSYKIGRPEVFFEIGRVSEYIGMGSYEE